MMLQPTYACFMPLIPTRRGRNYLVGNVK